MRLLIAALLIDLSFSYFLRDAQSYQQNRYNFGRYIDTLKREKLWHDLLQNGFLFLFFIFSIMSVSEADGLIVLFLCVYVYLFSKNEEKQPLTLVYTQRIKRLITLYAVLIALFVLLCTQLSKITIYVLMIPLFGFHSLFFIVTALLSVPLEKRIRRQYRQAASEKLAGCSCIKIGITGSYGKTSVKNILNQLLSMKYACCATPLSYNNEMGITRTIREKLTLSDEVFLCEMGADHVHEIEDLCRFVQPDYGIVTAVGLQHLATFKSLENILHEKLQLAEHAKKAVFINTDNEYLRNAQINNPIKRISYGVKQPADYQGVNIFCDASGSRFELLHENKRTAFETKLLGMHNILNCVGALAMADELGVDLELMKLALKTMPPIPHRLELKSFGCGRLIDNAYNSNPDSAKEALEVLAMMPGRHILITPGFIDLRAQTAFYCEQFGTQMKGIDLIVLIGRNAPDMERGCISVGIEEEKILHVDSMRRALEVVKAMMHENDTILIENDIPDAFLH